MDQRKVKDGITLYNDALHRKKDAVLNAKLIDHKVAKYMFNINRNIIGQRYHPFWRIILVEKK